MDTDITNWFIIINMKRCQANFFPPAPQARCFCPFSHLRVPGTLSRCSATTKEGTLKGPWC